MCAALFISLGSLAFVDSHSCVLSPLNMKGEGTFLCNMHGCAVWFTCSPLDWCCFCFSEIL